MHWPRPTRTTRPGSSPSAAYGEKARAQSSSQPDAARAEEVEVERDEAEAWEDKG